LLTSQTEKIEETLWVSLRMFEERKNLLNGMAKTTPRKSGQSTYSEQAKQTEVHIQRIRAMLIAPQPGIELAANEISSVARRAKVRKLRRQTSNRQGASEN
jgi:hypothetical protein